MTRPRILHVYKDYWPPVLGGIETTINLMARGTRDEFDPRVLVCAGASQPGLALIDGIPVRRVPEMGRFASAPFSPAFVSALREEARGTDIIHLHHPNPTGDLALLLSASRKPAVMTYHSDIVRQRFGRLLFGPVQEITMRRCRVVMPTSPNYVESSWWLARHRARCRVVPLGINLDRFVRTPEVDAAVGALRDGHRGFLVGFVGRLRYYKGLQFLVEAMRGLDATLLVGGTGPDGDRLRGLAAGMRNVVFLGDLDEAQLVALLHAVDVFCMPSHLRSEAFGLSMVEAMACATPVISTRIPTGVPFVNRDGESGLTVEPASAPALRKALERLMHDRGLRARLGNGALARAQARFSAEEMCRGVKEVYRSVLGTA